jgi:hypothetical protein
MRTDELKNRDLVEFDTGPKCRDQVRTPLVLRELSDASGLPEPASRLDR